MGYLEKGKKGGCQIVWSEGTDVADRNARAYAQG